MEYASNFASELCPEGIVAIAGSTLRIVTVNNLGATFNQTSVPLRYAPRKMCRFPGSKQLVVIETDHNEYSEAEKAVVAAANMSEEMSSTNEKDSMTEDDEEAATIVPLRGPIPANDGKWASCLRIIEPASGETLELLELTENEAAFSLCTCRFSTRLEETFIIVGTAKDLVLHPRKSRGAYIHVYRLLENRLQLLHKTELEDIPLAVCEFQGKLLVGVGKSLRLYELGKKKLLRKCENKLFPTSIVKLQVLIQSSS